MSLIFKFWSFSLQKLANVTFIYQLSENIKQCEKILQILRKTERYNLQILTFQLFSRENF